VHSKGVEVDGEPPQPLSGIDGGQLSTRGHKAPTLNQASAEHARLLRASNPFTQDHPQTGPMPSWEDLFSDEPLSLL
jgi:hypothetical protein